MKTSVGQAGCGNKDNYVTNQPFPASTKMLPANKKIDFLFLTIKYFMLLWFYTSCSENLPTRVEVQILLKPIKELQLNG